jgi:hypothetical protein
VAAQLDPEALRYRADRPLERLVRKRLHLAGALVHEVVVVAARIRDLVPRRAIAAVEPVQQPQLEQLVDHAVHRRGRPDPLGAQPIRDFWDAQQALPLAGEELQHRGARGAGAQAGSCHQLLGVREPAIAKLRVHGRSVTRVARSVRYAAGALRGGLERAVIVAVISVRPMEMVCDEVIDVIPVRHGLVPTAFAVDVVAVVSVATMLGRAALGTRVVDLQHVLVGVIPVRVMQMATVQVVDVVAVHDGAVSAFGSMLMSVIGVDGVILVHGDQCDRRDHNWQTAESETQSHTGGPQRSRPTGGAMSGHAGRATMAS